MVLYMNFTYIIRRKSLKMLGGELWLNFLTLVVLVVALVTVTLSYPHLAMAKVSSEVQFNYGKGLTFWDVSFDDPAVDSSTKPGEVFGFALWPMLATTMVVEPQVAYSPKSTHLHFGAALSGQLSTYTTDYKFRGYTVSPGLVIFYHHKKHDVSPFVKAYYRYTFMQNQGDLFRLARGSGYSLHLGAKLFFSPRGAIIFAYEHTRTVYANATGVSKTVETTDRDISKGTVQHELVDMNFKAKHGGLLVGLVYSFSATPAAKSKPTKKKKKSPRSKPAKS